MTKTANPEDNAIEFDLSPSDVESAIRAFICACHPEVASGYAVNPVYDTMPTNHIAFFAKKP